MSKPTRENVFDQLQAILTERLPEVVPSMVTEEASIKKDLGADSLDTIELVLYCEETFEIEISDDDLEKFKDCTVGEAVDLLHKLAADAK